MKNALSWGIRSMDYFGQPIQIKFNSKTKFKTVLGGVLSFLIYCLTIALIISTGSNLYNKVNPKTTMTNTIMSSMPLLNMSELNLVYAVTILDRFFMPLNDPSIYTLGVSQFKRSRQKDDSMLSEYIPLKKANCSIHKETFKQRGFEAEYIGNALESGVCFDSTNLVIGGLFSTDYFSNVNFQVKRCVNSTDSKVICKPKEVIDDRLLTAYFQLNYFDTSIDINNYLNPYSTSFTTYFLVMDPKASKFVDIFFKIVNITTDAGLIFQTEVHESAVSFDYFREQVQVQVVDNMIVDFYLNSSKNYLTYTRIYMKFQDFAATIGGLIKVMTLIGYFITIKFTHFAMYEKMFNCLYNFDFYGTNEIGCQTVNFASNVKIATTPDQTKPNEKKPDKQNTDKSINFKKKTRATFSSTDAFDSKHVVSTGTDAYESNRPIVQTTYAFDSNRPIVLTPFQEKSAANALKVRVDKQMEMNKKRFDKQIRLTPVDVIKMFCCNTCIFKQKRKFKLYKSAYSKLDNYLDYLKIVQTLQQFNRMKNVIFTKSQENLFLQHSKPLISYNPNERIARGSESLKENIKESTLTDDNYNIYKNYVKAKRKEATNKTYKRLLKNMDENLREIFENVKN